MGLVADNQVSYKVVQDSSKIYVSKNKKIDYKINVVNNSSNVVAFDITILFDNEVFRFDDNKIINSEYIRNIYISSNSRSIQVRGYLNKIVSLTEFNLFETELVLINSPKLGNTEIKLLDTTLYDADSINNEVFVTTLFATTQISTFFTDVYSNLPYIFLVLALIALATILILIYISKKHKSHALVLESENVQIVKEKTILTEVLESQQKLHKEQLDRLAEENSKLEKDAINFEKEKEEFARNLAVAGAGGASYYKETEDLLVEKGRLQAELADINKDSVGINKKLANNPNLGSDEVERLKEILENLAKRNITTKEDLDNLNKKLNDVRLRLIESNSKNNLSVETPGQQLSLSEELSFGARNANIKPGNFVVIKLSDGYHFELHNNENELLLTSSYGYKEASGVNNGVSSFKKMLDNALFQIVPVEVNNKKAYKLSIKNKNSMSSKYTYESTLYETVDELKTKLGQLLDVIDKAVILPYKE
jgi:uncharacterized protein YegP (UPF0339 family)